MKKVLFAVLITVSLVSSSFATAPVKEVKVGSRVAYALSSNFGNVSNVKWDVKPNFAKATFVYNDVETQAFFELDGNFIGSSHAISLESLPTITKRTFAKKYSGYTVKEAIHFDGADQSAYYISAENEKQSVILKVVNGSIEVFKSTLKN